MELIEHSRAGFAFLRGISAYSSGVVARSGHEIVRAVLIRPQPLARGFSEIAEHLSSHGVQKTALCGIELRSPRTFSTEEFRAFNAVYVTFLKEWGIPDGGLNPVARTNVMPLLFPPAEPSIYAFSYVVRSEGAYRTFVAAGAGELPEGSASSNDIVRAGDTTPDAMAEKARCVLGHMESRLTGLGVGWADVTAIDVYTGQDFGGELIRRLLQPAGQNTVAWHFANPPITGLEFEMDVRGVRRELVIGSSLP
ncbi:MAG: hypothetical protein U0Q18_26240 [Bryobacteraceae bacterium]